MTDKDCVRAYDSQGATVRGQHDWRLIIRPLSNFQVEYVWYCTRCTVVVIKDEPGR